MDLSLEQKRVDGAAEIVDDGVAFDGDDTGVGIDLDLDDVAAVGKGLCQRHAVMRRIESGLHARWQFRGIARRLGYLHKIDAEIGAGHGEYSLSESNVLCGDFKK